MTFILIYKIIAPISICGNPQTQITFKNKCRMIVTSLDLRRESHCLIKNQIIKSMAMKRSVFRMFIRMAGLSGVLKNRIEMMVVGNHPMRNEEQAGKPYKKQMNDFYFFSHF